MENPKTVTEDRIMDVMTDNAIQLIKIAKKKDKNFGDAIEELIAIFCAKTLADLFPEEEEEN